MQRSRRKEITRIREKKKSMKLKTGNQEKNQQNQNLIL